MAKTTTVGAKLPPDVKSAALVLQRAVAAQIEAKALVLKAAQQLRQVAESASTPCFERLNHAVCQEAAGIEHDIEGDENLDLEYIANEVDFIALVGLASTKRKAA